VTFAETPLESARREVKALAYPAALKALKRAAEQLNLTRAEVLELYELEGLVSGSLGHAAEAKAAFVRRLVLDPTFTLQGRPAPRVTTPFFEAKRQVTEDGALALSLGAPAVEGAFVRRVRVALWKDFLGWVASLRVHVREDGAAWREVELAPPAGEVAVAAAHVELWAEARSKEGWSLVLLGSESRPERVDAPPWRRSPRPRPCP
jgi:hypothetical protein